MVIDPSAPYASGIRAALPNALMAVGKWHLVALANQMVTEVWQRVTRIGWVAAAPSPTPSTQAAAQSPSALLQVSTLVE